MTKRTKNKGERNTRVSSEREALILLVFAELLSKKELHDLGVYYRSAQRATNDGKGQFIQNDLPFFWRKKVQNSISPSVVIELQRKYFEFCAESSQYSIVTFLDDNYPSCLFELDAFPVVLFIQSELHQNEIFIAMSQRNVGVVGTRRITGYGTYVTKKIIEELSTFNTQGKMAIVSGFMYGVDQIAHRAAMATGMTTIAVLAHGLERVPSRDVRLLAELVEMGGVVVSEYVPWAAAQKWTFIERNRIVAALSTVVLVTEAAAKSGSLHTVQFGLDLGRTIGAVPGPITNAYSEGTRWLINQGATLVASGGDIYTALTGQEVDRQPPAHTPTQNNDSSLSRILLSHISSQTLSTDELVEMTQQPLATIMGELSKLELQKRIQRQGNQWMLQYHL